MADDRGQAEDILRDASTDAGTEGEATPEVNWRSWSNLWQVPAIIVSLLVIAAGLFTAMYRAPANDFDGALDQIDTLIEQRQFDLAATQLNEVIEPALDKADATQQARFEATVADWISLSQRAAGLDLEANNRRVVEHYARAVDLGLQPSPERLERWAEAWISLGDLDAARVHLVELDAFADTSGAGLEIRRRRNRVLRRLVETSLRQPDLSDESMMDLLEDYRNDPMLTAADELWAIARQAELRIETGRAEEAVRHLLIDMRRFEPKLESDDTLTYAEVFTLLARGYYELGNFPYAEYHVEEAMGLFRKEDPARGIALVLLGQTAVANGLWHDAFELFDEVVRDYGRTRSAIPGRLGRAEVYSVLGDDDKSLDDYRKLHELLEGSRPRRDVTPTLVGDSLTDRHDAALTMDKLDAALEYVLLAETFYKSATTPPELLYRVASTSRQLADDQIAAAHQLQPDADFAQLEPATRYQANEHFKRAADYFVRHARTLAGRPGADDLWADSLWLAADSYDLGGWHSQAITHFTEYMAGRSEADPRRPDAVFRLAQAYHAELDWPSAVRFYEQVLDDHPRSHVASRSHVPLARCLLELGRRPEAEQQMLQVVMGEQHLKPDAIDYRDALIELGTLYYDDGEHVKAIERLDESLRRYPDDTRMGEIRYRLADSHRRNATALREQIGLPGLTPIDRDRLDRQRIAHLEKAADLFGVIVADDGGSGAGRLPESLVRYAYLYSADCVFDLGNYREAVDHYDRVAGRFPQHHSSMTALIQIVNCYASLGDTDRARTAHRRALMRLRKLPDEAFDAEDSLLERDAWERWLQNMPMGDPDASATAGASS